MLDMTEEHLLELRRAKWHLKGMPLRTLEDAREFIDSVGFCLMYPMKQPLVLLRVTPAGRADGPSTMSHEKVPVPPDVPMHWLNPFVFQTVCAFRSVVVMTIRSSTVTL